MVGFQRGYVMDSIVRSWLLLSQLLTSSCHLTTEINEETTVESFVTSSQEEDWLSSKPFLSSSITSHSQPINIPPSTPSTITTPKTIITTAPPIPTIEEIQTCLCDLTKSGCDINCCCDPDCGEFDRRRWAGCNEGRKKNEKSSGSCLPLHLSLFYPDNLLCIEEDNNPKRLIYKRRKMINTKEELNRAWREWRGPVWKVPSVSNPIYLTSHPPLLSVSNIFSGEDPVPIRLLTSHFSTGKCELSQTPIAYLVGFSSSCLIQIPDSPEGCSSGSTYITLFNNSLLILKKPLNSSKEQKLIKEDVVEVSIVNCQKEESCKKIEKISVPKFNKENNTCGPMVVQFQMVLQINRSSNEILKVKLTLKSVWVKAGNKMRARFRVSWEEIGSEKKGGLIGRQIKENSLLIPIHIPSPVPLSRTCSPLTQEVILFNQNMKVDCLIDNFISIEKQGLGWLLSGRWELSWGGFDGWVPLVTEEESTATCLILSLPYSLSGTPSSPVPYLLGAYISSCPSPLTHISTTVLFLDATPLPPRIKFAPPPTLSITLPKDFFYPFLLSQSAQIMTCEALMAIVVCFYLLQTLP